MNSFALEFNNHRMFSCHCKRTYPEWPFSDMFNTPLPKCFLKYFFKELCQYLLIQSSLRPLQCLNVLPPKNASHFSSIIVCFFLIYDSCQNINIKFDQKNEIFRYFVICLHKSIKAKWKKYLTFWKALGCFYHIRSYVKNSYTFTLIFTLHKTSSLSSKLELFYRETHSLRKTFEINLGD